MDIIHGGIKRIKFQKIFYIAHYLIIDLKKKDFLDLLIKKLQKILIII